MGKVFCQNFFVLAHNVLIIVLIEEFSTQKEADIYTELLATKVTLKDYEDKIKMYEKEKLRFIDTIEKLVIQCICVTAVICKHCILA